MENVIFSTEFFLGASTVGIVFGGYWLRNNITRYYDKLEKRIDNQSRWIDDREIEIYRILDSHKEEVNKRVSEMERDCLDRFKEIDRHIDVQVDDISGQLHDLRQEFDARIIGEARNVQRMVDRKLESQVEA
jgi:hypothetical protein